MIAPWQDLVGKAYRHGGRGPDAYDCLGLVLAVQRRAGFGVRDPLEAYRDGKAGHDFRAEWASTWRPVDSPRLYDAVLLRLADPETGVDGWHVGVIVEPGRAIHASRNGVVVTRLSRWAEAGAIRGYWRPTSEAPVGLELAPAEAPGIPAGFFGPSLLGTVGVFLGNLAIGGIVAFIARLISQPEKPNFHRDEDRPSFDLSGPRNTVAPGTSIPVVYGEHVVGGQVISLFQRADSNFRSRLYMLICLGEGPYQSIGGVTADANSVDSSTLGSNVKINGNPISGFPSAKASIRMGTLTQDIVPGFEESVVSGAVNADLVNTTHVGTNTTTVAENADTVTYTTSDDIDAFEVNIRFPIGLYKVDTQGNTQSYDWIGTLRYRIVGNPASEVAVLLSLGPSVLRSDHTRTVRIDNLTRDKYEISLTRSSLEDTDTTRRFSSSTWTTVNEINASEALAYPGCALIAIEALATNQLSGAIPQVSTIVKGRKPWIWDGVSTTSPAFTAAWSDNPAWIALDVLLNDRFGLGAYTTLNDIDLQSFKDWADYCAATITTDGVSHARWQFDHVFDVPQRAWDVLGQISAAGRASIIYYGSKFHAVIDTTASYSQVFGMGNVIASSYRESVANLNARANTVELQYLNRDTNYEQDVAQKTSENSSTATIRKDSLRLIGITRAHHAYRAVQWSLNVAQNLTRTLTFDAPIDAIAVEPGDVFRFAHDVPQLGYSGRFATCSYPTAVQFDRDVVIVSSGTLLWRSRDALTGAETFQSQSLPSGTYSAGSDFITGGLSALSANVFPHDKEVYLAGETSTYYRDYRVTKKTLTADFIVRIEAIEYNADVYDDDPGAIESFTDQWPSSLAIPDDVTYLSAREITATRKDGTIDHYVDVGFQPSKADAFDVWWRFAEPEDAGVDPSADAWQHAGSTVDGSFRFAIAAAYTRPVDISVTPRSPGGARNDPEAGVRTTISIMGRTDAPASPTVQALQTVDGKVIVHFDESADYDVAEYDLRQSSTAARWLFQQSLTGCSRCSPAIEFPHYYGTLYMLAKAVNTSGVPSLVPGSLSARIDKLAITFQFDDRISGSDWTATGTSVSNFTLGTDLESDASSTSATWQSADDTVALAGLHVRIHAMLDAYGVDRVTTWADAGWTWGSPHAARYLWGGELLDIPDPELRYSWDEAAFTWASPMAKTMLLGDPYDWRANYGILLEYRLASDDPPTMWGSWTEYVGPFETYQQEYVAWRVTFTSAEGDYQCALHALSIQAVDLTVSGSSSPAVDAITKAVVFG